VQSTSHGALLLELEKRRDYHGVQDVYKGKRDYQLPFQPALRMVNFNDPAEVALDTCAYPLTSGAGVWS
jgi:hypothetical protein